MAGRSLRDFNGKQGAVGSGFWLWEGREYDRAGWVVMILGWEARILNPLIDGCLHIGLGTLHSEGSGSGCPILG